MIQIFPGIQNEENSNRVTQAFHREKTDRVPFDLSMAGQSYFLSGWLGFNLRD
jgi:hypothetical protein